MSQKIILVFLIILTVCATVYIGIRAVKFTGGKDGRSFYYGSRLLLSGKNPYDNQTIVQAWKDQGSPNGYKPGLPDAPFIVPPIASLLFAPVILLNSPIQGIVFVRVLSVFCGLLMIFLLIKMSSLLWSREISLLFALYALLLPAFLRCIAFTQSTLIISVCLALCLYFISLKHNIWAGVFLGLSLAKFTLTFPILIILLYRRNWTASLGAIITFLTVNLVLFVPIGIKQAISDYKSTLIATSAPNGQNSQYDLTLVNLQHLILLVFGTHQSIARLATIMLTVAIISLMAYLYKPQQLLEIKQWANSTTVQSLGHPLDVPVAIMAGLELFYHRYYDLATLIFVAWGLLNYGFRWPERRSTLWKVNIGLLFIVSFLGSENFPFRRLDPVLSQFGVPPLFFLNCFFTMLLFMALLWLYFSDKQIYRNSPQKVVGLSVK